MAEQSHREEMNAAIRAQRERQAAPRTIASDEPEQIAPPEPEPVKPLLARLAARLRSK